MTPKEYSYRISLLFSASTASVLLYFLSGEVSAHDSQVPTPIAELKVDSLAPGYIPIASSVIMNESGTVSETNLTAEDHELATWIDTTGTLLVTSVTNPDTSLPRSIVSSILYERGQNPDELVVTQQATRYIKTDDSNLGTAEFTYELESETGNDSDLPETPITLVSTIANTGSSVQITQGYQEAAKQVYLSASHTGAEGSLVLTPTVEMLDGRASFSFTSDNLEQTISFNYHISSFIDEEFGGDITISFEDTLPVVFHTRRASIVFTEIDALTGFAQGFVKDEKTGTVRAFVARDKDISPEKERFIDGKEVDFSDIKTLLPWLMKYKAQQQE